MTVDDEKTDHETFEGMTDDEIDALLQELIEEDMKLTEWPRSKGTERSQARICSLLRKPPSRELFRAALRPRTMRPSIRAEGRAPG